jgi:predicted HicB family RNase H-like nuclease
LNTQETSTLTYKGYTAAVRLDLRDGILHGRVLGIRDVIDFHAERADEVAREFQTSVDAYLAACAQWGDPPETPAPGKFLLRTTADRHALITRAAQVAGKSVNEWAEETLTAAAQATLAAAPDGAQIPV